MLGEKPALFGAHEEFKIVSSLRNVQQNILLSGLYEMVGRYIYDPEQVETVIHKNPRIFSTTSPKDAMSDFSQQPLTVNNAQRGLILGIPLSACEDFEVELILKNFIHDKRNAPVFQQALNLIQEYGEEAEIQVVPALDTFALLDVLSVFHDHYRRFFARQMMQSNLGVIFMHANMTPEIEAKKKRLRDAFELSGILDIYNSLPNDIEDPNIDFRSFVLREVGILKP